MAGTTAIPATPGPVAGARGGVSTCSTVTSHKGSTTAQFGDVYAAQPVPQPKDWTAINTSSTVSRASRVGRSAVAKAPPTPGALGMGASTVRYLSGSQVHSVQSVPSSSG